MSLILDTAAAVGVLFVLAAVGWLLAWRRQLVAASLPLLSLLALDVALACSVFASILERFDPAARPDWWTLPLWWLGFTALSGLATLPAAWLAGGRLWREFAVCLFYPNAVFVPLAILTQTQGPDSPLLPDLFLLTLFFPAFFFGTAPLWFRPVRIRAAAAKFRHPVTLATVAALVLKLAGAAPAVPRVLIGATRQLGLMSVPLLMIVIGAKLRLDAQSAARRPPPWKQIAAFVLVKNVLFPAAALLLLRRLQLDSGLALLLYLQAAAPPITSAPVIVERAGGDSAAANQLLVASFLASGLTLPLGLWLL